MSLTFQLTDLDGVPLTTLTQRTNAHVELALNGTKTAAVDLSVEDEAAQLVRSMRCNLKVWLRDSIIFNGPVLQPTLNAGDTLTVPAVGPWYRLSRAFVRGLGKFTNDDQSEIMWDLIVHADRGLPSGGRSHGILRGDLAPASVDRTRDYPEGKNIWEAELELAAVNRGPDFDLRPIDTTDGGIARLDTFYPALGRDLTSVVIFEYQVGRETVEELKVEESGEIINRATVGGKSKKGRKKDAYVADHRDSQRLHGILQSFEIRSDVKENPTLQDLATRLVAQSAYPVEFFDLQAKPERPSIALADHPDDEAYGNPPLFGPGDDYWMGDAITVIDGTPGFEKARSGRVTDARLSETDAQETVVSISCEPRFTAEGITGGFVALRGEST